MLSIYVHIETQYIYNIYLYINGLYCVLYKVEYIICMISYDQSFSLQVNAKDTLEKIDNEYLQNNNSQQASKQASNNKKHQQYQQQQQKIERKKKKKQNRKKMPFQYHCKIDKNRFQFKCIYFVSLINRMRRQRCGIKTLFTIHKYICVWMYHLYQKIYQNFTYSQRILQNTNNKLHFLLENILVYFCFYLSLNAFHFNIWLKYKTKTQQISKVDTNT